MEGGRLHAIDHLKAAAIVAVVFTHAGHDLWGGPRWTWDFVTCGLWVRFQVPAFLFASGYLYARSSPIGPAELWSRLRRVLAPYLLASVMALLAGVTGTQSAREAVWRLATASTLGIYYYFLLLLICILLIWPLSRVGRRGAWLAWAACLVLTAFQLVEPSWRLATSLFWMFRDPLQAFRLGYFLSGWLVALSMPWLLRPGPPTARRLALLGAAGAVAGLAHNAGLLPGPRTEFGFMLYTFSVVALVVGVTSRRPAGPVIRFLGDASLGIYLYHRIFQLLTRPLTAAWPDPLRIAAQVTVGLAGAALLLLALRRFLGDRRARDWFGA